MKVLPDPISAIPIKVHPESKIGQAYFHFKIY